MLYHCQYSLEEDNNIKLMKAYDTALTIVTAFSQHHIVMVPKYSMLIQYQDLYYPLCLYHPGFLHS